MRILSAAGILLATLLTVASSSAQSEGATPPPWVQDEMEGMIGRWIADNSAYQSEEEPYEAYGVEWSWALGETSVVGYLFG